MFRKRRVVGIGWDKNFEKTSEEKDVCYFLWDDRMHFPKLRMKGGHTAAIKVNDLLKLVDVVCDKELKGELRKHSEDALKIKQLLETSLPARTYQALRDSFHGDVLSKQEKKMEAEYAEWLNRWGSKQGDAFKEFIRQINEKKTIKKRKILYDKEL